MVTRPLLDKCSQQAAVDHVGEHFDQRFQDPGEPLVSFQGLPDAEPDFTAGEVNLTGALKLGTNYRHFQSECRTVMLFRFGGFWS